MLIKETKDTSIDDLNELIGKTVFNSGVLHRGLGYVFFSRYALALRAIGYDGLKHMRSIKELVEAWDSDKVISVADTESMTDLSSNLIKSGKQYAIWGAGILGEYFAKTVRLSGGDVPFFVDAAEDKQGQDFGGILICSPKFLIEKADDYDVLIIANHTYFDEIASEAGKMGIGVDKLIMPYDMISSIGRVRN